jgi:hypothetical protein
MWLGLFLVLGWTMGCSVAWLLGCELGSSRAALICQVSPSLLSFSFPFLFYVFNSVLIQI